MPETPSSGNWKDWALGVVFVLALAFATAWARHVDVSIDALGAKAASVSEAQSKDTGRLDAVIQQLNRIEGKVDRLAESHP